MHGAGRVNFLNNAIVVLIVNGFKQKSKLQTLNLSFSYLNVIDASLHLEVTKVFFALLNCRNRQ